MVRRVNGFGKQASTTCGPKFRFQHLTISENIYATYSTRINIKDYIRLHSSCILHYGRPSYDNTNLSSGDSRRGAWRWARGRLAFINLILDFIVSHIIDRQNICFEALRAPPHRLRSARHGFNSIGRVPRPPTHF